MHFDNDGFHQNIMNIEKLWGELQDECDEFRRLHLFGQITHAVHDFYSHTDYAEKFLAANPSATPDDTTFLK